MVTVSVVVLAIGVALTAAAQDAARGVVVYVNNEPIHDWELKLLLPQVEADMASRGVDPRGRAVMETMIGRAIDSTLLAQEARRRGIEPNQERIDAKMSALSDQAGGRGALEAALIKSGVTYDELRSTVVQADLVRTLVEEEHGGEIDEPSDDEVEAYFREHAELFTEPDKIHTRQIMIKVDADATKAERDEARTRAEAARERAVAGEDFAALARKVSDGPNASRGGDLGYTSRGDMIPAFDDVVWSTDVGGITNVIETNMGFHVAKVEDVRKGDPVPLDKARPFIESLISQRRNAQIIASLLADLRSTADIREPGQ
jgi:parvulin-like peptidyl-prolyl isomerase